MPDLDKPASQPETAQAPVEPTQQPTPAAIPVPQPQKPKSAKVGVWIIGILVAILLVGGGWYAYQLAKKSATPAAAAKKDIPLIRMGMANGPVNVFYPASTAGDGTFFVNAQIFEGLVKFQNGTQIVPLLASSWTNPDDSTWIFNLVPNVKFHTGRTMTADDVKYSLESFKDQAYAGEFGTTIKSVQVITPTQVKITTNGPDPILLHRLAYLAIGDSKSTKKNDPINGTGPYQLKANTDPVKDNITDLVAFDDYHGGHVYTRELQLTEIDNESDATAQFKSHKIDLYDEYIALSSLQALKQIGITATVDPSTVVIMLGANTNKGALANLKIRQALDTGLNRKALVAAGGQDGQAIEQFVIQAIPGYDPSITVPATDIVKAKQLVTDSGIKNPTFTISYISADVTPIVTELQKQAATFGITVKLDMSASGQTLFDQYLAGKSDAAYIGWAPDLLDATDTWGALFQGSDYSSPTVDKLMTQAGQTLDATKRLGILKQVAGKLHDDVAAVPLFTRNQYYARTNTNYSLHRDIPNASIGVYFWKVYQN